MEIDKLIEDLFKEEGRKHELSNVQSDRCWSEISKAVAKKQSFIYRLRKNFYRLSRTIPLRDIGFAAAIIALCLLVPIEVAKYKYSIKQYNHNSGSPQIIKNNNNNKNDNNTVNNTGLIDNSESELYEKLYKIADNTAETKFKNYCTELISTYDDYVFYIREITEEDRIPKVLQLKIDKDSLEVKDNSDSSGTKYTINVIDLINTVEGYSNGTFDAYDIPEKDTASVKYYVHGKSQVDPDKIIYSYNFETQTLSKQDSETGEFKAIYTYKLNSDGPMIKKLEADLDGDGVNEQITYDVVSSILTVNNLKMYVQFMGDEDYNSIVRTIDIDESDHLKELVLKEVYPNDYQYSHIFYYSGGLLKYCGNPEASDIQLDGSGTITAKDTICQFFETSARDEIYKLDIYHRLHLVPKDFYSADDYKIGFRENSNEGKVLTLKKDLPLMKDKNSSEIAITLKAGEKVRFLGSDYNRWVLLENSQGVKGWIEIDYTNQKIKSIDSYTWDVFDGLILAG